MLQRLKEILDKEKFTTKLEPAVENESLERLVVLVDIDNHNDLLCELIVVPDNDQEVENYQLLQSFVSFPDELDDLSENTLGEINDLILKINYFLPLGHFGIELNEGVIFYKYVSLVEKELSETALARLVESVWVSGYMLNTYYPLFKGLIDGSKTLADYSDLL